MEFKGDKRLVFPWIGCGTCAVCARGDEHLCLKPQALGVNRVITMSGCPAGAVPGSLSVFPCWATSADDERLFDWQMQHEVGPFWRSVSDRLEKEAPGLMVCLDLEQYDFSKGSTSPIRACDPG